MTESLPANKTISHYRILHKLGAGGMGEVYLAEDTKLDRKVAIKCLPPESTADQQAKNRLVREARAAAKLDHPNICSIHEVGEEEHQSFIVMQYIEGETLAKLIQRRLLELREALDIAVQIADALAEAHSRGIVHRDIKPQNVMITARGQVKVLDFGLAKIVQQKSLADSAAETESPLTEPGMIIGTVPYMSPEQVRGEVLDARSDIFSLGAVLYEIVTGTQPFAAANPASTMSTILTKEPPLLARYSREVPSELERIVTKTLRKNRDQRYQTIQDLLLDLKSLAQELEFEKQLERSARQKSTSKEEPRQPDGAETVMGSARPTLNEKGATTAATLNQRSVVIPFVALLVIASAAGAYFYFTRALSPAINSVAVLPFINASGNSEVEYLSDGLTESLITSLSQLPKLSVKARSSVFRYKGKDAPPQQVGKELNVQVILNGRVVQRGNDLTLHIELVDVNTETALWSADYNSSMTNLVLLPSEIARDVSSKLRLKLSSPDEQKLAKNYTANAEAYQLYLKGRYHVLKLRRSETQKGIAYFQQAIEFDPSYALAYVGLAEAYRALTLSGEMSSTEFLPKAKAAAQKAVEIDDTLSAAHAQLGFIIFWYDWDWEAAEKQCKRALELDPNNADAHDAYAHVLSNTGRHAEGLAEIRRAGELDPLNLRINVLEGQSLIDAGQADEALASLQKTFELDPNFWFTHWFASSAYIEKGMFAEAIGEARKARELSGANSQTTGSLGYALAKSGKQAEARGLLEELLQLSTGRYVPPSSIALIYNGLDERKETLAWLERGYKERDPRMAYLKVEPNWNNLRADPRFRDLLRRLNLLQ